MTIFKMAHENNTKKNADTVSSRSFLQIENLSVTRSDNVLLREINLSIPSGEMVILIGPNGGGKTTLFKALIGDIPYHGEVHYINKEGKESKPRIGYVPQRLEFDTESPVSVLDLFGSGFARLPVWLGHSSKLQEKVKHNLARVGGEHLLHRPLGQLSGGELQRVLLALALNPLPDLLLLDEPFSAVDQNGMENFYELVAGLVHEFNIIVLLVSHEFQLAARFAQQMIFLNQSIKVLGTPEEVLADQTFRQAFSSYNIIKDYDLNKLMKRRNHR